eukprot:comp22695_c0_seq1/m.35170 comp22695_c0_seq1/g.35170  ORF comp22695_c0_seq1/g.35170 comp22695_c0_seq1/m.35170 type:complete len:403 (-) comp22695_c0_seq1:659-1867(-)
MVQQFGDVFWGKGDEFTGEYPGFDALYSRMKESHSMSHALLEVVAKRAQLEKQYGESLVKLAETKHKDTVGDMRGAWDTMMTAMRDIGVKHIEVSKVLAGEVGAKLRDFSTKQRATRQAAKKGFMEKQTAREKAYQQMLKAKKASEKAYHEYEATSDQMANAPSNQAPKDAEKLRNKYDKSKIAAETCDMEYRQACTALDAARLVWEAEWEACCKTFQDMEHERILQLRNDMWMTANLGSLATVHDDKQYEAIRQSLVVVDVDKELDTMVASRQTGRERPASIPYVSCSRDAPQTSTYAAQPTHADAAAYTVAKRDSFASNDGLPPVANEPHKSVSPPPPIVEAMSGTPYRALFDYTPQGAAELGFHKGDTIYVENMEEDPWWRATANGQAGMVYKEFLEPI